MIREKGTEKWKKLVYVNCLYYTYCTFTKCIM